MLNQKNVIVCWGLCLTFLSASHLHPPDVHRAQGSHFWVKAARRRWGGHVEQHASVRLHLSPPDVLAGLCGCQVRQQTGLHLLGLRHRLNRLHLRWSAGLRLQTTKFPVSVDCTIPQSAATAGLFCLIGGPLHMQRVHAGKQNHQRPWNRWRPMCENHPAADPWAAGESRRQLHNHHW